MYILQSEEQRIESGVGFHPACFELFRIVSEVVFGKVNTDGLVQMRNICCTSRTRIFCDWGEDIGNCREYSNPVFIPGFRDICEDALQTDEDFDVQQSAFPQREGRQNQSVSADPFLSLPSE